MRLHLFTPWSLMTALLLSATACDKPPPRVAGTWKNHWAIEHQEIQDEGGLVLREDGTMTHFVLMPDGSSAESKGTYQYADGFLLVTETESYRTDADGRRIKTDIQIWGGEVTFLSANEIIIADPNHGPITLVREP